MIYGGQVILVHLDILEPAQILCIVHWCIASPNQVMLTELLTLHMHGIAEGGSGGQVPAGMHGCQVAARCMCLSTCFSPGLFELKIACLRNLSLKQAVRLRFLACPTLGRTYK